MELNKIYNEDCLETMKRMPDNFVDLVLTDPPYGVGIDYGLYDDTVDNWKELVSSFIPEAKRISRMIIMPSCQINLLHWIYANFKPDWLMCWYKGSPGHKSYIGFNDWEPLLVYGKTGKPMHDYIKANNVEKMGNWGHPCPKPVKWASTLINMATDEDMLVYDPFIGSGTTAVACERLGIQWLGSEINPDYCEIANKRIKAERDQMKLAI